jgi:hypothetical protein
LIYIDKLLGTAEDGSINGDGRGWEDCISPGRWMRLRVSWRKAWYYTIDTQYRISSRRGVHLHLHPTRTRQDHRVLGMRTSVRGLSESGGSQDKDKRGVRASEG